MEKYVFKILSIPRPAKRLVALFIDLLICIFSVLFSFYLRLGFIPFNVLLKPLIISISLVMPIFISMGFYRTIFRHSEVLAMVSIIKGGILYGIPFAIIIFIIGVEGVPRTIGLIQPLILILLVLISRFFIRALLGDSYKSQVLLGKSSRALIYGVGKSGRQLAASIISSKDIGICGFIDDDTSLHGHFVNGLPIYDPKKLGEISDSLSVNLILLALPNISRDRRNEILNYLSEHHLMVRTVPAGADLVMSNFSELNTVDLDVNDLLGRAPVEPNQLLLKTAAQGKTILVTGAGGSIGSELCRQLVRYRPKKVLLLEVSEFSLYSIHKELENYLSKLQEQDSRRDSSNSTNDNCTNNLTTEIIPLLGSVCDSDRVDRIISTWKPDTIYHAAAYKHVPLVEHNPLDGVRNNVWGTLECAKLAMQYGVKNFVLISTDKAVRPTNIMGASKRLAEMVLQGLASVVGDFKGDNSTPVKSETIYSIVRFGNVLGSSGSVIPLFRDQIRAGGPITLTHPDITRYFMSTPEAAQLVIQASVIANSGDLFLLDMGSPVRIQDLADRMVKLSGSSIRSESNPQGQIDILITGLRPGEKLYEELLIGNDCIPTIHPSIVRAREEMLPWDILEQKLETLKKFIQHGNVQELIFMLQDLIKGYQPSGDVVDWVQSASNSKVGAFK